MEQKDVRGKNRSRKWHTYNTRKRSRNSLNTSSKNIEFIYINSDYSLDSTREVKRVKRTHYSPEVVVEIYDQKGELCPIRALVDSGTTSTLLLKRYVNKVSPKAYKKPTHTLWKTMGGTFLTRQKRQVEFSFPEFSTDKTITWIIHVDDRTDDNNSLYDMIIGTDLMSALGMKLDFETKEITWEGNIVPMKIRNFLSDRENTQHVNMCTSLVY